MTEPPAAPELPLLATDTVCCGVLLPVEFVMSGVAVVAAVVPPVAVVVVMFSYLQAFCGRDCSDSLKARGADLIGPRPAASSRDRLAGHYGSFCNSVNTFCGTVLACATIAVLDCCRIWARDSAEVAAAKSVS